MFVLALLHLVSCTCTEVRTGTATIPDGEVWVSGGPYWLGSCRDACQGAGVAGVTDCAFTGWVEDADTADTGGYDWPAVNVSCTGAWPAECPA